MAGGFTGTPEDFAKAHSDVTEIKAQMDQNLNTLRGNIEATRAGWQSGGDGGAVAFQTMMTKFDEKARACTNVLQNIGDMLEQSGVEYQRAEEEQSSHISSVSAMLDG